MNTNIEYFNNFSSSNDNIVIFVSKISQLNSIILPFNSKNLLKNKEFTSRIKESNYFSFTCENSNNLDSFINIKIFLLDKTLSAIELGASLHNLFNFKYDFNISLVFSKPIQPLSSDIVFGFMLKNYEFDKYKKIKN